MSALASPDEAISWAPVCFNKSFARAIRGRSELKGDMFSIRRPDWEGVPLRESEARHRIALPVIDLNITVRLRSYRQRQPLAVGREARHVILAWRGWQGLRLPGAVHPGDRPPCGGRLAAQINLDAQDLAPWVRDESRFVSVRVTRSRNSAGRTSKGSTRDWHNGT
jgi:hypothetical protein